MRVDPADLRIFQGFGGPDGDRVPSRTWRICIFLNSARPLAPPILRRGGHEDGCRPGQHQARGHVHMPRQPTGNVYESYGRWYARVTIGPDQRPSFALPTCTTEDQARERLALLAGLATKLRGIEHVTPEVLRGLLERAAARDGKALDAVLRAADALCRGEAVPKKRAAPTQAGVTFAELARRWTSGKLASEYPDRVKRKRRVEADVSYLKNYIIPVLGDVLVPSFTLDHAEAVMRSLPATLEPVTRRQIGLAIAPRP
jgi:hypothetical protein